MQQQIKHESEQERQHARYRIPIVITALGHIYKVKDWSVDGFAMEGQFTFDSKRPFKAKIHIKLDQFNMDFDIEALPIWQDKNITGCKFQNLNAHQLSILRYLIDAFISGEIIYADDILQIVKRNNLQSERVTNSTGEKRITPKMLSRITKSSMGFSALAIIFALLGLFTFNTMYNKLFYIESPYAVIEGPVVVIRAPQPSYFDPLDVHVGKKIEEGTSIASVEMINGGAVAIDSPCNCEVIKQHVLAREFVGTGEPLYTLLPLKKDLYVRAQIKASDLKRIESGNTAKIRMPNNETYNAEIVSLKSGAPLEKRSAAVLANTPTNPQTYIEAILNVRDVALDHKYLNTPVSVSISTI